MSNDALPTRRYSMAGQLAVRHEGKFSLIDAQNGFGNRPLPKGTRITLLCRVRPGGRTVYFRRLQGMRRVVRESGGFAQPSFEKMLHFVHGHCQHDKRLRWHGAGSAGNRRRAIGPRVSDRDQRGDGRRPVHIVDDGQSLVDPRGLKV